MISSFDRYQQIESPNMYLCNPDRRHICALNGKNRRLTLRFNDLSQLTFTVPKIEGAETYYDMIEPKRLVFVEKIGWFQIANVSEIKEGDNNYKEVTAHSHQYALKDRGFVTEERVYMFYNPNDPTDSIYNELSQKSLSGAESKAKYDKAIPSVIGQLYQQLGIKRSLDSSDSDPIEDYGEWTVTYIDPSLEFVSKSYDDMYAPADNSHNVCRTFEADSLNGYDFMMNKVENAFEVIFEFDYLHHSIKIKRLQDVTKPTNIYLSFDNLLTSMNITENSEDIVTVMSCEGNDVDIRTVNPMGTNYIVNFDYYKKHKSDDGAIDYPWMSKELITALNCWEKEYAKWQDDDESRIGHTKSYTTLTKELQELYLKKSKADADIEYANLKLSDLYAVRDQYNDEEDEAEDNNDETGGREGYVTAENVNIGDNSLLATSAFYNIQLNEDSTVLGHTSAPKPEKQSDGHYKFSFEDEGTQGTLKKLIENYIDSNTEEDNAAVAWYFIDDSENRSYCKLTVASEVGVVKDADGNIAGSGTAEVRGVKLGVAETSDEIIVTLPDGNKLLLTPSNSYFVYDGTKYRILASADGIVTAYAFYVSGFERYTCVEEIVGMHGWIFIWENHINHDLKEISDGIKSRIKNIEDEMQYVSNECDIQRYIKRRGQDLYDELAYYWIEGEYSNNNIAAHDATTMAERIDLAKELMEAGKVDLAKCSQPQFEMSADSVNFIKLYDFCQFADELALGRVITVEKSQDVCYRPALMSIEYDIDDAESFSMTFSNASKPQETSMTFADLIKQSSSTSRTVSSNWSNLTDYSRNKGEITDLILNPLDRTLRASQADMAAQAFVIDDTGILGRKYDKEADESGGMFLPEQMRIINNTILFTTDNWETSALALGKIKYGENGETAYGLIADVLVGNLVLGRELKILNENNSITLDRAGITIKKINGENVFCANTDGDVYLKGEIVANKGKIGGLTIEENSIASSSGNFTVDSEGNLIAKSGSIGGYVIGEKALTGDSVGMRSGEDDVSAGRETKDGDDVVYAFWAGNNEPDKAPFRVTNKGFISASGTIETTDIDIFGHITASSGELGKLTFDYNGIRSNGEKLLLGVDGDIVAKNITVSSIGGEADTGKFEFAKATSTERMYYDYSVVIGDKYSTITVTTKSSSNGEKKALTAPKTFNFKVTYRNGAFHCSNMVNITINKDESSKTQQIPTNRYQTINHTLKNGNDVKALTEIEWSQSTDSVLKTITCDGNFIPVESKKYDLGTGDKRWNEIWCCHVDELSDIKDKHSIVILSDKYSELFDMLNPVSYKLKCGTSDRRHTGLIANEVKDALIKLNIDTKDFAAYCEYKKEDGTYGCGLRYNEFISLSISEIQKLKKRVLELEAIIQNK